MSIQQLSPAARIMLGRRPRRHTITERQDIIQQITRTDSPVFEPIVAFQAQYGGIKYTISGSVEGFSFDLFDGFDRNEPWEFDAFQDEQGC